MVRLHFFSNKLYINYYIGMVALYMYCTPKNKEEKQNWANIIITLLYTHNNIIQYKTLLPEYF